MKNGLRKIIVASAAILAIGFSAGVGYCANDERTTVKEPKRVVPKVILVIEELSRIESLLFCCKHDLAFRQKDISYLNMMHINRTFFRKYHKTAPILLENMGFFKESLEERKKIFRADEKTKDRYICGLVMINDIYNRFETLCPLLFCYRNGITPSNEIISLATAFYPEDSKILSSYFKLRRRNE